MNVENRTTISYIDSNGALTYRGYDIKDLAVNSTFEEVVHLLVFGKLPNKNELANTKKELKNRKLSPKSIKLIKTFPKNCSPLSALREVISDIALNDMEQDDISEKSNIKKALKLIAVIPTIAAAVERHKKGWGIIAPKTDLSLAGNFLYMLNGKKPTKEEERIMEVSLILHADHGFNASTFAARITASTRSDFYSSIISAIGTLKGPLHGGANIMALKQQKELNKKNVEKEVLAMLSRKQRIMGIGHKVYKVKDPRAIILEKYAENIANPKYFKTAKEIERIMKEQKGLYPNVDFLSGMVYEALGVSQDSCICLFVMGRVAGWSAHLLEQYKENSSLIRPMSVYIGEKNKEYVPVEKRK